MTIWIRSDETRTLAIDKDPPAHKRAIGKLRQFFPYLSSFWHTKDGDT